jgi:long-chain acyl-CoA synthetase
MGGEIQYAVSGGAALGERLTHFFNGIGVQVCEGYGLTETTAASTFNRPRLTKVGTVGKPIPGASVKIAEDGEILLKGAHIFQGYHNNPEATAEVLRGRLVPHRRPRPGRRRGLRAITGRKKELIVTAGGKNVAPAVLEDRIRAHALVSQCMVIGDASPSSPR